MNYCVILDTTNQYYCNKCRIAHGELYIDLDKNRFCRECVDLHQGDVIKIMDQNRNILGYKEVK